MQAYREASLSLQLPLVAASCALLVGLCVVWLATTSGAYLQESRDSAHGEALAAQVAYTVSDSLQRGDLLSVRASLQRFVDNSLAEGIRVNDVMGLPIGEAGSVNRLGQNAYRAAISVDTDIAGEVLLTLERGSSDDDRLRQMFSLLALVIALSLLVFLATRYLAQRLATRLRAIESQLLLPESETSPNGNEIAVLRRAVEQLPVDMLKGHASVPAAASDFRDTTVLFVHLAGLARYVNTLSESNLHRYTRRLQQLLQAAVQCYRGQLRVTRQFGVLVTFSAQQNAGSEALRAASCARLIAIITRALEERTSLSLDLAMALGHCELSAHDSDDMYPELYLQGSIDELRESCLNLDEHPTIFVARTVLEDAQLSGVAETALTSSEDSPTGAPLIELLALSPQQEILLQHQSELIVERITAQRRRANS